MFTQRTPAFLASIALFAATALVSGNSAAQTHYQHQETRQLVALVKDAADLVRVKGEAAFADFRVPGSRWRQGEAYIFVLDPQGNMQVHPDPAMEGKNELDLKDINGKPIIRGLLSAVATFSDKPDGWYHYQWPVPGEILPRWKSTYARLVTAVSGKRYIVASGVYNDRMERTFVEDLVNDAVKQIERGGGAALRLFHDPKGPFIAKDAYIFVYDMNGINLALPAFPNLEGRNLIDIKDTQGKFLIREMLKLVQTTGSGWVDYMWPKPGESVSTQKSSYVRRAKMGDKWVMVGSGVYLADAPTAAPVARMTAPELMALVRDGAALLEQRGRRAYADFRIRGSRWFRDDTYFFVLTTDGINNFHAAEPGRQGRNEIDLKDMLGRPFIKMFIDATAGPSGEGWVHYMYPEPGGIFPTWKSTFVKRVTFPSGQQHIIACGIYNMQMDPTFIEDVVNRAAALIAAQGKGAFEQLRDKTGSFVFMDTYVFVDTPDGTEVVNPAQPSLEGMNIIDLKDAKGKTLAREYISAAMKEGTAWVDYYWYKPGHNTPAHKRAYVRRVQAKDGTYIVGSGLYLPDETPTSLSEESKAREQR